MNVSIYAIVNLVELKKNFKPLQTNDLKLTG